MCSSKHRSLPEELMNTTSVENDFTIIENKIFDGTFLNKRRSIINSVPRVRDVQNCDSVSKNVHQSLETTKKQNLKRTRTLPTSAEKFTRSKKDYDSGERKRKAQSESVSTVVKHVRTPKHVIENVKKIKLLPTREHKKRISSMSNLKSKSSPFHRTISNERNVLSNGFNNVSHSDASETNDKKNRKMRVCFKTNNNLITDVKVRKKGCSLSESSGYLEQNTSSSLKNAKPQNNELDKSKVIDKRAQKHKSKSGKNLSHISKKKHSDLKRSSCTSESELSDWEEVEGKPFNMNNEITNLSGLNTEDEVAALLSLTKKTERAESSSVGTLSNVEIELDAPQLWGARNPNKKSDEYWRMVYLRQTVNRSIKEDYLNCHKVHLLLLLCYGLHINRLVYSEELLATALSIVTNKDVYPPKRTNLKYLEIFVKWFTKKITTVNAQFEAGYWFVPLCKILVKRFEEKQARSNRELVLMFVLVARSVGMTVRLIQSLKPLSWKPTRDDLFRPVFTNDGKILPSTSTGIEKQTYKRIESNADTKSTVTTVQEMNVLEIHDKNTNKRSLSELDSSELEHDSDFEIKCKKIKKSLMKCSATKINDKLINKNNSNASSIKSSSKRSHVSDNVSGTSKKRTENSISEWAEVFVEEEERWISVDVVNGKIHCDCEIASRALSPVAYVTAFNPDQTVKDVTRRYVSKWLSFENKLRPDSKWWAKVLVPYAPIFSPREKAENKLLDEGLKQQPLPKTIAEYKNHPLYVLQRHLLKFEALYPPNPDPVGYFKGEAVYPRSCVHTLHSREIWLKEAKTVKVGEEPYKVVKARPKWDRVNCKIITDQPLDIFGFWQTEDYKPPVAKDGKVPRNEYGNVELFKPTMLPEGTVHLSSYYENIGRTARKLQIDCAPAMVGFDYHKGGTHPVFDGYVVCQEFKDVLVDAWNEEMEMKIKREKEKKMCRILDNWKKLVQGLLVKDHIREKYGALLAENSGKTAALKKEKKTIKSMPGTKLSCRKIKQKDLDAVAPENCQKVELGVDFSGDTVAMAKSFKETITSHDKNLRLGKDADVEKIIPKAEDLILDSDEEITETEEEKKHNLQKILAWGKDASKSDSMADLSDISDLDEEDQVKTGDLNKFAALKEKTSLGTPQKSKKYMKKLKSSDEEFEGFSSLHECANKWLTRRSKVSVSYRESDSDISVDDNDTEDKTYCPHTAFTGSVDCHLSEESE